MNKLTWIFKAVESVPFDHCIISTCASDCEVRNCNFKLFFVMTFTDNEKLLFCRGSSFKEFKCLVNCCEHIVAVNNSTNCAFVILINHYLIAFSNFSINHINNECSCDISICNSDCLRTYNVRIKRGNLIISNQIKHKVVFIRTLTKYCNRKTCQIQSFTQFINCANVAIEVNAVACSCVSGKLFNSIISKPHAIRLVNDNIVCNGLIILVCNCDGI